MALVNTPVDGSPLILLRQNSESFKIFRENKNAFYSPRGLGNSEPKSTLPGNYFDNVARFEDAENDIYGRGSIYAQDVPFSNFGFRQPYVWTELNDSNFKKFIKRYDNRALPIGSAIQDQERLSKMLLSGQGLKHIATQFLLQGQNAFDETRLYNPLSINSAAARPIGSIFGQDRPLRFIDTGGGIGGAILGLFGFGGKSTTAPRSTVGDTALSTLASGQGAGLLRGHTAAGGKAHFDAIWLDGGESASGGLLGKLGQSLKNKLKTFTAPFSGIFASGQEEFYRGDETSYNTMVRSGVANTTGPLVRNFPGNNLSLIKNFNGGSVTREDPRKAENKYLDNTIDPLVVDNRNNKAFDSVSIKNKFTNSIVNKSNELSVPSPNINPIDNKIINDLNSKFENTELFDYSRLNAIAKTSEAQHRNYKGAGRHPTQGYYKKSNSKITGDNIAFNSREKKFLFPNASGNEAERGDLVNRLGIIDFKQQDNYKNGKSDIIPFFFNDLVNGEYIIFRATLKGISQNTNPEWNDIKYLGRADKVYLYNGVTRDLSFNFRVYASSYKEMKPMWKRVDRLQGLCYPSTNLDIVDGGKYKAMVPPFMKLTIGDLYVNQPSIIKSFSISIPDESPWEIGRTSGDKLPMIVDVNISCTLIEKTLPAARNLRFGDPLEYVEKINAPRPPTKPKNSKPEIAPVDLSEEKTQERQDAGITPVPDATVTTTTTTITSQFKGRILPDPEFRDFPTSQGSTASDDF